MNQKISTLEELSALPAGAVIMSESSVFGEHGNAIAWQKDRWYDWRSMDGTRSSAYLVSEGPFFVVWPPLPVMTAAIVVDATPPRPTATRDELVDAVRKAWSGKTVIAHGRTFTAPPQVNDGGVTAALIDTAVDEVLSHLISATVSEEQRAAASQAAYQTYVEDGGQTLATRDLTNAITDAVIAALGIEVRP